MGFMMASSSKASLQPLPLLRKVGEPLCCIGTPCFGPVHLWQFTLLCTGCCCLCPGHLEVASTCGSEFGFMMQQDGRFGHHGLPLRNLAAKLQNEEGSGSRINATVLCEAATGDRHSAAPFASGPCWIPRCSVKDLLNMPGG